jgi:hypothetical protein
MGTLALFVGLLLPRPVSAGPAHDVCDACHDPHPGGALLGPAYTDNPDTEALCLSCHGPSGPGPEVAVHTNGAGSNVPAFTQTCMDCHWPHNDPQNGNLKMVREVIDSPVSGLVSVVFTSRGTDAGGPAANSFADNSDSPPYDGVCEVCHSHANNSYHHYNGVDPNEANHNDGRTCTNCHGHRDSFAAQDCSSVPCHRPGHGDGGAHTRHVDELGMPCSTCHFGKGPGQPDHANGVVDVVFDPAGLATRNGNDTGTSPNFDVTVPGACDEVYCHSTGTTADRGRGDGTGDRGTGGSLAWTSTYDTPLGAVVYGNPDWYVDVITTCAPCHAGRGNMTSPYYVYRTGPITGVNDYPDSGSHRRSAHNSNSQDFGGVPSISTDWDYVQCFWCHNPLGADPINGNNTQGTYGTAFHLDGKTFFQPRQHQNGGTMANGLSYSSEGSAAHCGNGKTCW